MRASARVAWNLRRLRVQAGLSQEALAVDAGVDTSYVSRIERGLENPTVGLLEQIANVLRADVIEFFRTPDPDEQAPKPLKSGRRRNRE